MADFWSYDNLERITGGQWLVEPDDDAPPASGLNHDSRQVRPGQVYLAVVGDNHDGHRFVDMAMQKGAAAAIVSDEACYGPGPRLLVDNTVAALQDLASAYRDVLAAAGCKVLAVCGSNGKTTTRHLLHHVLSAAGLIGTQSPKSFNNHLGVPLTLLAAEPDHDFVAAELGTNHPGEIAALGEITWPDAAIITSIGQEHLEFFKTIDGVAMEEAAIMPFVRKGGIIATPAAAAQLMMPFYDVQEEVVLLPARDAEAVDGAFPLLGEHNRMNAALALSVLRWWGREVPRDVWQGLEPPAGRMHRRAFGQGVTLLDDSYNANPDSMRASLEVLSMQPGDRRVAVLGEMRELGSAGPAAHAEVRELAGRLADEVVCLGEGFGAQPWGEQTAAAVAERLRPGDTVLIKASRGMGLERIIPAVEAKFGSAEVDRSI